MTDMVSKTTQYCQELFILETETYHVDEKTPQLASLGSTTAPY